MCELCASALQSGLSRRRLIGAVSAALAVAAAGPAPANISGDDALHKLMQGNERYRSNHTHMRDFAVGRAERVSTHRPIASLLSCADARVGPEFIFDQGPGQLFVVRVAGNLLEAEGLASLEYAAAVLGSPLIFVLGHSGCGAIDSTIKVVQTNTSLPGNLPGLIDQLKPAVLEAQKSHPANLLDASILENVRMQIERVSKAQPMLAEMVSQGKVKVAGGLYDIGTGRVSLVT